MMNDKPAVDVEILLSVYNGEQYLSEQLRSILNQTFTRWRVLARDDGSSDGSLDILMGYQDLYPDKFIVFPGDNLGPVQSFNWLAQQSSAQYVMFCDQDDIWYPDKIEAMVDAAHTAESDVNASSPLLVYSDLTLIDEEGSIISDSFWRSHGINPRHNTLNRLVLQNVVTGCASLMNRTLLRLSLPIRRDAIIHDWWFALHACLVGKLILVNRPTVYYRQHGMNVIGTRRVDFARMIGIISGKLSIHQRLREIFTKTSAQASAVRDSVKQDAANEQLFFLDQYSTITTMSNLQRKLFFIKKGIFFTSRLRTVCLLIS